MLKKSLRVLIDTNVLITAVKSRWTRSTDLLAYLLTTRNITLVMNRALIAEYRRYTDKLKVPQLLSYLLAKAVIIEPSRNHIDQCRSFISPSEAADLIHAASCLEAQGILVTNDKDFDRIKLSGIIIVWTITEAIQNFL